MHLGITLGVWLSGRDPGGGIPKTFSSAMAPKASCRPGSRSSSPAISMHRRMQSSRYRRSWWNRITAHSHKGRLCVSGSPSASQSRRILADSSSSRSRSSATLRESLMKSSLIAYSSSPTLTLPAQRVQRQRHRQSSRRPNPSDSVQRERALPVPRAALLAGLRGGLASRFLNASACASSSCSSTGKPSYRCWRTATSSPCRAWRASSARNSDMVGGARGAAAHSPRVAVA